MQTARLFPNGQSQAVRLPKEFRFAGEMKDLFDRHAPERAAGQEEMLAARALRLHAELVTSRPDLYATMPPLRLVAIAADRASVNG